MARLSRRSCGTFFPSSWRRTICNSSKPEPMGTAPSGAGGPVQQAIERKVTETLRPISFKIVNDSHKHAGHAGNPSGAPDAETHFTCTIESSAFDGKSRIQQHRMVYELLGEEFAQGLHALALKTSAPK